MQRRCCSDRQSISEAYDVAKSNSKELRLLRVTTSCFLVVEYGKQSRNKSAKGGKTKKSKTKQTGQSFLTSKLGTYTVQYVSIVVGYVFVGNFLQDSLISQLLFTSMFGLYLFWFSLRFDTIAGVKGDW